MQNRFSKIILVTVTIVCVFLMVVSYTDDSYINPLREAVGYLLEPVESGISSFGHAAASAIDENTHLHEVYAENEALTERIAYLTEENNRLREESAELERLRALYELDQRYMQYDKIAARVIAKDSQKWFNIFRLDKGLSDGIEKDMNVISGSGLVGIVTEVGPTYCTVRSIIDDDSNIYAESQSSGETCLVKGGMEEFENGTLLITNISKTAVFNDGDAVVTSSLSTKYLPGLLIGYASDISVESQHLTKTGKLIPVADFDHLKEVLILTTLRTDYGLLDTGAVVSEAGAN